MVEYVDERRSTMARKNKILFVIVVLWTCVIWGMSLQPAEVSSDFSSGLFGKILRIFFPDVWGRLDEIPMATLEMWHWIFRKFAHFTEYFILGILWFGVLSQCETINKRIKTALICILTALVDEMLIQRFVPGRSGQLTDVALDSIGAVIGMFLVWSAAYVINKKMRRRDINDL